MLVGSLGGAAGTATGVSLVAAGATAAQAIAVANATALAATSTVTVPTLDLLRCSASRVSRFWRPLRPEPRQWRPPRRSRQRHCGWHLQDRLDGLWRDWECWRSRWHGRASKLKVRDQLEDAARDQIRQVFSRLRAEHLPALRKMPRTITEEFHLRLNRRVHEIETAMRSVKERQLSPEDVSRLRRRFERLRELLAKWASESTALPALGSDAR